MTAETRIMLASGALFDIADPHGSDFTLHDIAHGLARVCRFAGQTATFYSVAEHSIHVARLVPHGLKRAALLHDAAEAFIGDVTSPLKRMLPDYQVIEARVADAIAQRLLGQSGDVFKDGHIKAADAAMCMAEARIFMPTAPRTAPDYWRVPDIAAPFWGMARETRFNVQPFEKTTEAFIRAWNRAGWNEAREEGEAA